ncbi:unnamed protein product [Amaranthus hypochondriacus]
MSNNIGVSEEVSQSYWGQLLDHDWCDTWCGKYALEQLYNGEGDDESEHESVDEDDDLDEGFELNGDKEDNTNDDFKANEVEDNEIDVNDILDGLIEEVEGGDIDTNHDEFKLARDKVN